MYMTNRPIYWSSYCTTFFSYLSGSLLILLTILVGYILSLIPSSIWSLPLFYPLELRLPAPFSGLNHYDWLGLLFLFKPQWTLLLVMYWALARPQIMGITLAWCVGFGLDILQLGLAGENAVVFAIICFLVLKLRARILSFPLLIQTGIIWLLLSVGQFLVLWIQWMMGGMTVHSMPGWGYWLQSVGGAIMWPALLFVLPKFQGSMTDR